MEYEKDRAEHSGGLKWSWQVKILQWSQVKVESRVGGAVRQQWARSFYGNVSAIQHKEEENQKCRMYNLDKERILVAFHALW
jgi:hypothetical protein